MGKRVLERVLDLRKETCLIEKLRGLKSRESVAKFLLGLIRDGLEECERYILADDGRRLKKTLLLRWQPINSGGKDSLHCCRYLGVLNRFGKTIISSLTCQNICFYECPDTLLQEEWIPLVRPIKSGLSGIRLASSPSSA